MIVLTFIFSFACTQEQPPADLLASTEESEVTSIGVPTQVISPTQMPHPSPTSMTIEDLEGFLFFDRNGNGLWESNETPISEFGVCATISEKEEICTVTDERGRYQFQQLAPLGMLAILRFSDPNVDDPSLSFRYINMWKKSVTIPPIEMEGLIIPEQQLNDTQLIPLSDDGFSVYVGDTYEIGLIQGFLSWPVDRDSSYIATFYDHESTFGEVLDWRGNTIMGECTPFRWPLNGVCDNHDGSDFISFPINGITSSFNIQEDGTGAPVYASFGGTVNWAKPIGNGVLHVTLDHTVDNHPFQTGYGHLSVILVQFGEKILRGQIVGLVGSTGTGSPHLHFNLHDNAVFRDDGSPATLDPWGDPKGSYPFFWVENPDLADFILINN